MTQWIIKHGDLLDEPADVLVCSANVFLNLSGGVGGALLLRYGDAMQRELHRILKERGAKFVPQGTMIEVPACGTPYKCVLHAVAVDGFYDSSPAVVESLLRQCISRAAELGARRVALAALATGFGHLSLRQFAEAATKVMSCGIEPVEEVVICLSRQSDAEELSAALPVVLYRPVGQKKLDLIRDSGWRRFPPRLASQPIFYPVLSEDYAIRIARDWNTKDAASDFVGYVTRFLVDRVFLGRYEVHQAGERRLLEYWIPAEDLEIFNDHIVGPIEVIHEFRPAGGVKG